MKLNEILDVYRRDDYMSLSLKERRAVVREISKRYKKVKKKEKGRSLPVIMDIEETEKITSGKGSE